MNVKKILQSLGPGLLFAGAAVGVSHLVYSTRAGALYGFGLVWLVLMANLFKYPFFEFGPRYAVATGESLLKGYQRLGTWVLGLFGLITLGSMFTIQAAVTIVTASLANYLFGDWVNAVFWQSCFGSPITVMAWVGILLAFCALLLLVGRYHLLDKLMKIIIIGLTIITLCTVLIAFGKHQAPLSLAQEFPTDKAGILFLIAFMGWMPAPLDLSVWHSLWALEKKQDEEADFNLQKSLFDFNIGYLGTTILALFFVALGALVMHGSGTTFSPKGAVFAQQLILLYTDTLGSKMGIFVGLAAFITMFSTTITCLDALPRSMAKAHVLLLTSKEDKNEEKLASNPAASKQYYLGWLLVLIVGALLILNLFLTNMASFLMIATILSFLTTPFFAIANYLLVTRYLPEEQQPSLATKVLSWLGIAYLFVFCGIYLWSLV